MTKKSVWSDLYNAYIPEGADTSQYTNVSGDNLSKLTTQKKLGVVGLLKDSGFSQNDMPLYGEESPDMLRLLSEQKITALVSPRDAKDGKEKYYQAGRHRTWEKGLNDL